MPDFDSLSFSFVFYPGRSTRIPDVTIALVHPGHSKVSGYFLAYEVWLECCSRTLYETSGSYLSDPYLLQLIQMESHRSARKNIASHQ
jgi:hypothetical protein